MPCLSLLHSSGWINISFYPTSTCVLLFAKSQLHETNTLKKTCFDGYLNCAIGLVWFFGLMEKKKNPQMILISSCRSILILALINQNIFSSFYKGTTAGIWAQHYKTGLWFVSGNTNESMCVCFFSPSPPQTVQPDRFPAEAQHIGYQIMILERINVNTFNGTTKVTFEMVLGLYRVVVFFKNM